MTAPLVIDGVYVREGAGGPVFRATGYNSHVMKAAGGTAAQTMSTAQREAFFARLRSKSLVRVWFFGPAPGTFTWTSVLAELDAIVASAKKGEHRIVACLTDWGGAANDAYGAKTAAWFTGRQWRTSVAGSTSYEAWVKTVAARYAGEPTVAAYDLINEPQDPTAAITADLTLFAQEASGWIKAAAPDALCYMGAQYPAAVGGNTAYQAIFANLDFCSSHHYDAAGFLSSRLGSVACARALGKPLLVDEYGVWAKAYQGAWADSDKDSNGLPAVSYAAQGQLVRTELQTAFEVPEVFGALAWSAMDSGAAWFDGTIGCYEPPNDSLARETIRTLAFPSGGGQLADLTSSVQGWIDSCFTARYAPGTQIGGPASGPTTLNLIYDRLNVNVRQSAQASAPYAATYRAPDGAAWPSLRFAGGHWFQHPAMSTGAGPTHSLYAVVSPTALPAPGAYAYLICPGSASSGFSVRINSAGLVELYQYGPGGTVIGTGTTALAVGKLWLVEVCWDAVNSGWRIRVNGNPDASGAAAKTLAAGTANIGAEAAGVNGFAGHLLELVKTSNLATGAERGRYYSYFARKYPALG